MPGRHQIRMGVVLGRLKKEEMEIIDPSLRAKQVVFKVLDASATKFETPSDAERLRTVQE